MSTTLSSDTSTLAGIRRWRVVDAIDSGPPERIQVGPQEGVLLAVRPERADFSEFDAPAWSGPRAWPLVVCIDHADVDQLLVTEGSAEQCVHEASYPARFAGALKNLVSRLRPDAVLGVNWTGHYHSTISDCATCTLAYQAESGEAPPLSREPGADLNRWLAWTRARTSDLWSALDRAITDVAPESEAIRWIGLLPGAAADQASQHLDVRALAASAPIRFADVSGFSGPGRAFRSREAVRRLVGAGASPVVGVLPPFGFGSPDVITEDLELSTLAALVMNQGAGLAATPEAWLTIDSAIGGSVAGRPCSDVALTWSNRNREHYGADWAQLLVDRPYEGMAAALNQMNASFRSIPVEDLPLHVAELKLLILPNIAVLTDDDATAVREFVRSGGSLLATGESGRFDGDGAPRSQNVLADVLGVTFPSPADRLAPITANVMHGFQPLPPLGRLKGPATEQSYLRLHPELARTTAGPHVTREPVDTGERHEILRGFHDTDLLAFGGLIPGIAVDADRETIMTLVPGFRSSPIEKVFPDPERTDIPGLVVGTFGAGRVVYLPADIDRRYGVDPLPDQFTLLRNIVQWLGGDAVEITGDGTVATEVHDTPDGLQLRLVNLTGFDRRGGQRRTLAPATGITARVSASGPNEPPRVHSIDRLEHHMTLPLG